MKSKTLRKKILQKSNRKELCINLFEDVKQNFHPISLSFQMGRNKLQNKLKRAKGRNITKVEEESKESSPELDHLARQETSEAKVEDEVLEDPVENIAGLGEMDLDGYHMISWCSSPPTDSLVALESVGQDPSSQLPGHILGRVQTTCHGAPVWNPWHFAPRLKYINILFFWEILFVSDSGWDERDLVWILLLIHHFKSRFLAIAFPCEAQAKRLWQILL